MCFCLLFSPFPFFLYVYFSSFLVLFIAQLSEAVLSASLQRGKTKPNEFSGYDTKQSDGEVPLMLEL